MSPRGPGDRKGARAALGDPGLAWALDARPGPAETQPSPLSCGYARGAPSPGLEEGEEDARAARLAGSGERARRVYFSVALIPRIHVPEQRGIRTERVDSSSFSEQNARLTSLRLLQLMSEQVVFLVPYREFLCPQFPRDGRKRAALSVEISDILEISECPVLQLHSLIHKVLSPMPFT